MTPSMNLCSSGHEEVCYASLKCPACELKDQMQQEINDKQKEIDEHECEVPA